MKLKEALRTSRYAAVWVKPSARDRSVHAHCWAALSTKPAGDLAIAARGFQIYRCGAHHDDEHPPFVPAAVKTLPDPAPAR